MAKVLLTDDAREDLRDLDGATAKRVLRKLKDLETDPELRGQPLGSRAGGNLTGLRKLTVGDRHIRIIYRVEEDDTIAVVWVIAERADDHCYEMAVARLKLQSGSPALTRNIQRMLDVAWKGSTPEPAHSSDD